MSCFGWDGKTGPGLLQGAMVHGLTGKGKAFGSDAPGDGSQSNHHNVSHFKRPSPGKIEGLFINITYK